MVTKQRALRPAADLARIVRGGMAGLTGGVVFGIMMHVMGMMAMVAMLLDSESLAVGWAFHLFNSFTLGAILGAVVATDRLGAGTGYGLAWGFILWIVTGMLVMRTWLGMPIALDDAAMISLVGHLVWGAIAGATYAGLQRAAPRGKSRSRTTV